MKHLLAVAGLIATLATATAANAETILSVTAPDASGKPMTRSLSAEDVAALPMTEVKTANDYSEGMRSFKGPLLRELFGDAKIKPTDEISLTALNDYSVKIPAKDVLDYNVIVAFTMDGERMSVREKGPLWVIYPMSEHKELQEPKYNDRLIWQLSKMELHPSH